VIVPDLVQLQIVAGVSPRAAARPRWLSVCIGYAETLPVIAVRFSRQALSTHAEKLTPSMEAAFLASFSTFISIVIDGLFLVRPVGGLPILRFCVTRFSLIAGRIKTDFMRP
tara:strand:- start:428 stop:763 length:336 start_codon:yes stop_codon:yes gene_type:complete